MVTFGKLPVSVRDGHALPDADEHDGDRTPDQDAFDEFAHDEHPLVVDGMVGFWTVGHAETVEDFPKRLAQLEEADPDDQKSDDFLSLHVMFTPVMPKSMKCSTTSANYTI